MKVMMREGEGYFLYPDPHFAEYHNGPVGEVSEETLGRWKAIEAQWKGLQAELTAVYSEWSNREFRERQEQDEGH